jgi:hypothetical protein
MNLARIPAVLWTTAVLLGCREGLRSQSQTTYLVPGPILAGNGVTDGVGATLGQLFVRLARPDTGGAESLALRLVVSSGAVTVDPISCSEPEAGGCDDPGEGLAAVSGAPTSLVGPVMALKLAGAAYIPSGPLLGASVEVALQGSLYCGAASQPGEPCEIRLFLAQPAQLLSWATETDAAGSRRSYGRSTGAGAVIGDVRLLLFPGWLRGRVARNDGVSILVEIDEAEIDPVRVGDEIQTWLRPDREAAAASGLPEGVFGQIQVNYSGFPGPSYVMPGAVSNDVEIHATAVPQERRFIRGDCNGDGEIGGTVTDALTLLLHNFSGGPLPPCLAACDANGDGSVIGDIADAVYLLRHTFLGGPAPPAPYPGCGPLHPGDSLGCSSPSHCP